MNKRSCLKILLCVISFIVFGLNNSFASTSAYKRIFFNWNIYACSFTDTSHFTLSKPAYIHKLAIWYKWSPGEKTVSYVLYRNNRVFLRGVFRKGGCDRYQRMWCSGEDFPDKVFPKGNYVLKVGRAKQCQNSRSNHNGFVELVGYWTDEVGKREKIFYYPKIKGYRLDWCRIWGRDCGKGAADAFCRLKGYTEAKSWEIDPDIGLRSPTYVIDSGQICNQSFCDGFKYITCTSERKISDAYKRIFFNWNIYACSFTDTSHFTLSKPAYIHKLAIWYKWSPGEKTVSYVLYRNNRVFLRGVFRKGGCDRYQRMWCSGEDFPDKVFPKGNYVLKVGRAKQCQNSRSNHNGFVELVGY